MVKTVYVIKDDEIRTPGWLGSTVAKIKPDGTIRYNKPQEPSGISTPTLRNDTAIQKSKIIDDSSTPISEPTQDDFKTLDELQKRIDTEQGCVVDYTKFPRKKKLLCTSKIF